MGFFRIGIESLRKWTDRNSPTSNQQKGFNATANREKMLHAKSSEKLIRACAYCDAADHKSINCEKVSNIDQRKEMLAKNVYASTVQVQNIQQRRVQAKPCAETVEESITLQSVKRKSLQVNQCVQLKKIKSYIPLSWFQSMVLTAEPYLIQEMGVLMHRQN